MSNFEMKINSKFTQTSPKQNKKSFFRKPQLNLVHCASKGTSMH